jgi:putative inorganic carbon (HCO3(-)) transporter
MKDTLLHFINKSIPLSFYTLFFLVPLLIYPKTFELFEFNKMWFVFAMALVIFFLWAVKTILLGKLQIRRTPLDIPILLFVASQIIATIFSLDPYVSFWGYYSRFNGGILSTLTYVFLYYAFASTMISHEEGEQKKASFKLLFISLLSGFVVALWGFPSHFGYDPTCFVFRGSFDVSCWTEQFQPKVRIFSTLGQPNWLAAYLGILLPLSIGFGIVSIREQIKKRIKNNIEQYSFIAEVFSWKSFFYFLAILLFYLGLIFAKSQSAFIGVFVGMQVFLTLLFAFTTGTHKFNLRNILRDTYFKYIFIVNLIFLTITFYLGTPIGILNKVATYDGLRTLITQSSISKQEAPKEIQVGGPALEGGGTDSGEIRLHVWAGALKIFVANPLFGTGVETFAYAYYKVKPTSHNLTSEWDYLYNKAHNEYLNYAATTGIFGLGTYLLFVGWFLVGIIRDLIKRKTHDMTYFPISLALIGGFISILLSNFFGFSVVVINLFLFFIPLFFYELEFPSKLMRVTTFSFGKKEEDENLKKKIKNEKLTTKQNIAIICTGLLILYFEFLLITYWVADQKYALGYNLNRVGDYAAAYQPLTDAVTLRPGESVFKDELSINLATLAVLLAQQKQIEQAQEVAGQAIALSDEVTRKHPNNVVYFKSRTRVFYALSQLNPEYLNDAQKAIARASELAPTDAKITYNMALLYNQQGDTEKSIFYLKKAVELRPIYEDAWYAMAVIYDELRKTTTDTQMATNYRQEAIRALDVVLKMYPNHEAATALHKKLTVN